MAPAPDHAGYERGHDHGFDHGRHIRGPGGDSHAHKTFGRAFATDTALTLGFVIVEVAYGDLTGPATTCELELDTTV